jgi:hypothetical protein
MVEGSPVSKADGRLDGGGAGSPVDGNVGVVGSTVFAADCSTLDGEEAKPAGAETPGAFSKVVAIT